MLAIPAGGNGSRPYRPSGRRFDAETASDLLDNSSLRHAFQPDAACLGGGFPGPLRGGNLKARPLSSIVEDHEILVLPPPLDGGNAGAPRSSR